MPDRHHYKSPQASCLRGLYPVPTRKRLHGIHVFGGVTGLVGENRNSILSLPHTLTISAMAGLMSRTVLVLYCSFSTVVKYHRHIGMLHLLKLGSNEKFHDFWGQIS